MFCLLYGVRLWKLSSLALCCFCFAAFCSYGSTRRQFLRLLSLCDDNKSFFCFLNCGRRFFSADKRLQQTRPVNPERSQPTVDQLILPKVKSQFDTLSLKGDNIYLNRQISNPSILT